MVEQLTTEVFLTDVFDYKNSKEWDYKGDTPCVIDFYADWCGPCKMVAPVMDELSEELGNKVKFYKVNTEQEQELAGAFGIQSIPSILFIPADDKPQMAVGALPKASLKQAINEVLKVETD